jgi:hypothetical protein
LSLSQAWAPALLIHDGDWTAVLVKGEKSPWGGFRGCFAAWFPLGSLLQPLFSIAEQGFVQLPAELSCFLADCGWLCMGAVLRFMTTFTE